MTENRSRCTVEPPPETRQELFGDVKDAVATVRENDAKVFVDPGKTERETVSALRRPFTAQCEPQASRVRGKAWSRSHNHAGGLTVTECAHMLMSKVSCDVQDDLGIVGV